MKRAMLPVLLIALFASQSPLQASQVSQKTESLEEFRNAQRQLIKEKGQDAKTIYDACFKKAYRWFINTDSATRQREIRDGLQNFNVTSA